MSVVTLLLLTGCKTVSSSACPPLFKYTKQEQQQAAEELTELPADSVLRDMIVNYSAQRQNLRACNNL